MGRTRAHEGARHAPHDDGAIVDDVQVAPVALGYVKGFENKLEAAFDDVDVALTLGEQRASAIKLRLHEVDAREKLVRFWFLNEEQVGRFGGNFIGTQSASSLCDQAQKILSERLAHADKRRLRVLDER